MGEQMAPEERYQDVFATRYCKKSQLMSLLSEAHRARLWRQLWCWLAEAELEEGLQSVTRAQVDAMYAAVNNIDWDLQRESEAKTRHDVISHITAFKHAVPSAAGIIHLGATSCYVQDNADILILRDALDLLLPKLVDVLRKLETFAEAHAQTPTVGMTHLQPASLTTVGKRTLLWLQDCLIAAREIHAFRQSMRLRGIQGATGTADSFLSLFKGDWSAVKAVNSRILALATKGEGKGLAGGFLVTGQTYPRLEDARLLASLAHLGAAAHKMCWDVRLLQSQRQLMEGFGASQVGSSAMPYKRNPMKCERACGLARLLLNLPGNAWQTAASQGLERTLDDSVNRRVVLSQALLTTEALLSTLQEIVPSLAVLSGTAAKVAEELPFLAIEKVLMGLVEAGKDRQEAHEKLRSASLTAHEAREAGKPMSLEQILASDSFFDPIRDQIHAYASPEAFIGACPQQVQEFLHDELRPFLAQFQGVTAEVLPLTV